MARRAVREAAETILAHLNKSAGRGFEPVDSHLVAIEARLQEVEGDVDGVCRMIDRQVALWGKDEKMSQYLRPETLFRKSKFRSYYDDRSQPVPSRRGNRGTDLGKFPIPSAPGTPSTATIGTTF